MNGHRPMKSRPFILAFRPPLLAAVLALLALAALCVGLTDAGAGLGAATLAPDHATVGSWTEIRLVYVAGPGGIALGGGIQVQFPKSWHGEWGSPFVPQTVDPAGAYYVTAQTAQPGTTLSITVANHTLDGRTDPQDWTATLTVHGVALAAQEAITYTFGAQAHGGAGAKAGGTAMTEFVRVAVDAEGDGSFVEVPGSPALTTTARKARWLAVAAPSQAIAGQPMRLVVTAMDAATNAVEWYTGTVAFSSSDPQAELPPPYTFTTADRGSRPVTVTLHVTGTQWITVTNGDLAPGGQRSNPVRCTSSAAQPSLYWGDLHSHTEASFDGHGPLAQALHRARDVLGLDFYAATDHIEAPATGLTASEWQAQRATMQAYAIPDKFVTLLGYEWSMAAPFGHHNVYFRDDDGPLCYLNNCATLEALWTALGGAAALTIPHHTGVRWAAGAVAVDWTHNNTQFRTSIEIYSSHGQSEMYDPSSPLSYENRRPGSAWSVDGPHYARDAWAAGHRVGVVAGSDNHGARPGIPWFGLTAIYADSLSRSALFDAIRARHTYATTGQRILLDFRLGEAMMGDVVYWPTRSGRLALPTGGWASSVEAAVVEGAATETGPALDVSVQGTDAIDWVELVRYDGITYTVIYGAAPEPGDDLRLVEFRYVDVPPERDTLYYVRMQQRDPLQPRSPAMAWSSPIWIDLCPVHLEGIELAGPSEARTGLPAVFTAGVLPADATAPVTFTWSPEPLSGQGATSATYAWALPGLYSVTVEAQNCGGRAAASREIRIAPRAHLYLPLAQR